MTKTTNCRGCGKRIIFAVDENGKRQVLDAVAPVYNIVFEPEGGEPQCARVTSSFVSHFATCSKASDFSKQKK